MSFKKLLKDRSISQANLAQKIGVSQALISKWANGTCEPQLVMLPKLAEIFGVDIETILESFGK